jgi:hypothetical protein
MEDTRIITSETPQQSSNPSKSLGGTKRLITYERAVLANMVRCTVCAGTRSGRKSSDAEGTVCSTAAGRRPLPLFACRVRVTAREPIKITYELRTVQVLRIRHVFAADGQMLARYGNNEVGSVDRFLGLFWFLHSCLFSFLCSRFERDVWMYRCWMHAHDDSLMRLATTSNSAHRVTF